MAKPKARKGDAGTKTKPRSPDARWAGLTWDDLDRWAGSRSVSRGRTYQRGGRVKDLRISREGELLATVVGGERYATTVALGPKRKQATLESACTCPVGAGCKHAVAVVAEYLQALTDKKDVPLATEDDPRWADLADDADDDWDEDDDDNDEEDEEEDDDDLEELPVRKSRSPKRPVPRGKTRVSWDDRIEQHLRAKSQGELADLVWSLTRRFPEVYQEFRERIALQEGDVKQLVAEARREIRQVTSEVAWRDHWSNEGNIPDYSPIRHRFERLLELGHADEVVSLGREFIELGLRQVRDAEDEEGETATAFAECLPVVFQAVMRSSLSGPERLLFAIDAEMADDDDAIGDAIAVVFDAPAKPEDWSAVADILIGRLKTGTARGVADGDSFSRDYRRDLATDWIANALGEAGREEELQTLLESEARATGSYERIVTFLLQKRRFEDAERWAREGITATVAKYPGIADQLATHLGELALRRKQWDVVAAHAARPFFEHPSPSTFDELIKAAGKAGVEEPVRAAALRFLETGATPFQVIAPRPRPAAVPTPGPRSPVKKRSAATPTRPVTTSPGPDPAAPARVKIDPAWPLPMPDYFLVLLNRPRGYNTEPRPHLGVLLEMAIAAKRPDEVLRWFDKMRAENTRPGYYNQSREYADRVAEAVSGTHPERAIAIYTAALNAQLPEAQQPAYEIAARYLRLLRPIYEALGRAGEWTALLASIRETYRNRPRFMEILDRLDGRTIVRSTPAKRR